MSMWKRLCSLSLAVVLCLAPAQALQADEIGSRTAAMIEVHTGQVLYGKANDTAQPAGVAAQMMTVLLTLEEHTDLTQLVTITPDMLRVPEGAPVLGLQVDEQVTLRNLLSAVMLDGSADAAQALGVFVAGTVPGFVERMNARAAAWDDQTVFTSAHGYDEGNLMSTNALAQMGAALAQLEKYCIMAKEAVATLGETSARPETVIYTENVQIRPDSTRYDPTVTAVMGGKTDTSGWVQVTYVADTQLVTVSMGAPNGTTAVQDSQMLLESSASDFTSRTFTALELQALAQQSGLTLPADTFTDSTIYIPNGLEGQPLQLGLNGTTLNLMAGDTVLSPLLNVEVVLSKPTNPRNATDTPAPVTPTTPDAENTDQPAQEGASLDWSRVLILLGAAILALAGIAYVVVKLRHGQVEEFDEIYEEEYSYDREEVEEMPYIPADIPADTIVGMSAQEVAMAQAMAVPEPAPEPRAPQPKRESREPREPRVLAPNRGREERDLKREAIRRAYIEAFGIDPEQALEQAEPEPVEQPPMVEEQTEQVEQAEQLDQAEQPVEAPAAEASAESEQPPAPPLPMPFPMPDINEQREMSTQELLALVESMKTLSGIPNPAVVHAAQAQGNGQIVVPVVQKQVVADIQTAQEGVESTLKELELLMQETLSAANGDQPAPQQPEEDFVNPLDEIAMAKTQELPELTDDMIAQIDALKEML